MRLNRDPAETERFVEQTGIREYFDTPGLEFYLRYYEKGEYLTFPDQALDELLFLAEGSVQIYAIRLDGTVAPVNLSTSPALLGDLEFTTRRAPDFFAEAKTPVVCVCLSVSRWRGQLDRDLKFLHLLLRGYMEKLELFARTDAAFPTLEEKLLLCLEHRPDHELDGVEAAALRLRCSRRQLQRVLKKLCDEGRLVKTGRGRYRLCFAD